MTPRSLPRGQSAADLDAGCQATASKVCFPPAESPLLEQGSLFATFGGKMIEPVAVKDSFLRGSPTFSQKVAKRPPRPEQVAAVGRYPASTRLVGGLMLLHAFIHPNGDARDAITHRAQL